MNFISFKKKNNKSQVLQFMAEEKLPKELAAKQAELQIYEKVINQRNVSREHLSELQEQVNHHLGILQ